MSDEHEILNALCPTHDLEPHFVGGVRIERNTWLAGSPPRIRITGEFTDEFQVMIDGHPTHLAADGAHEAPNWDSAGEHRLWFADRTVSYALRIISEGWDGWPAHDFGTGAAICGATILPSASLRHPVRIPLKNPLLIGPQPGEIFVCPVRDDVRSESILAFVPFNPVWALPSDPLHADKRSARIVLLHSRPPATGVDSAKRADCDFRRTLWRWIEAINDAGRKQLALDRDDGGARILWKRYRAVAKQLWRNMR
jgi:hypothetical protein